MSNKNISHVSIIMDGNGRWATQRNMPRVHGHREGIKSINKIVSACSVRQISQLTLFAFSSENWKRPEYEVQFLLKLFEDSIIKYINDLHSNNVKIKFIGNLDIFGKKLLDSIRNAEKITMNNTGLKLNFALNYGGKWDIINAFNKILDDNNSSLQNKKINIDDFEKYLSLGGDSPDLLIRTAGEQRLSNFMLWQHAYTELYFTDCLWPDFDEKELDVAIQHYQNIIRKYGSLTSENSIDKKNVK
ncbi:MAG: di-trans,poly-cis-decaprenylcistransferase [Gammaproteobacteria bacterium]|nr:di-trans,poly-cis-decaprenylcistransferase [Gammaproteobacteria bacterium]